MSANSSFTTAGGPGGRKQQFPQVASNGKPRTGGSGRPAGVDAPIASSRLVRGSSNPRNSLDKTPTSAADDTAAPRSTVPFNAKEAVDFLSSRLVAAQEQYKKWNEAVAAGEADAGEQKVFSYQGETRAWGSARSFNPVKEDFLQLVEMAIDSYKNNADSGATESPGAASA